MDPKTLEAALKHLSDQIEALADEDSEEAETKKAELVAQKAELEAKKDNETKESEIERLRRRDRERMLEDQAKAVSTSIIEKIRKDQEEEADRLAKLVQEQVATALGGGSVEDAVKSALYGTRNGPRFVGQEASESLVEHVANGGSTKTVDRITIENKGAEAECKAIFESKSIGHFFSIVARARQSEFLLSDGEKMFLHKVSAKALAEGTGSAGGFLVPTEWMPDVLGLLRAAAVVRRAGPRIVPFNKLMNQTSISAGASASYTGENARIAPSEQTFAEAPLLTPKNLTGLVPVSNYLLADAPQADEIVRQDMAEVMALREDLAFLRGTGAGGEPTGLRNIATAALNPVTVPTNGFTPTLADMRRIRAVFRQQNAGAVRLAWFFNPAFLTYLETRTDSDGRFLLDTALLNVNEDGVSGTFDGVPFYTSTQIPINLTQGSATNATDVMLVNMSETIVGINQELEVATSSEASWSADGTTWNSAFQQNQTLFRTVIRHDINHRRPAAGIVVQTGVLV